jgi:atypical dual specificity phosphatase
VDDDIIVGAIPLRNYGHRRLLISLGISGILAIIEPYELHTVGLFTYPVQPNDWPPNIAYKMIQVPDYHAPTQDQIREGIAFIEENRDRGPVYVHCKVGRGRSVVIAACYLLKKHCWTPEKALAHIKSLRPQICPNKKQKQAIEEFYNSITLKTS